MLGSGDAAHTIPSKPERRPERVDMYELCRISRLEHHKNGLASTHASPRQSRGSRATA